VLVHWLGSKHRSKLAEHFYRAHVQSIRIVYEVRYNIGLAPSLLMSILMAFIVIADRMSCCWTRTSGYIMAVAIVVGHSTCGAAVHVVGLKGDLDGLRAVHSIAVAKPSVALSSLTTIDER